MDRMLVQKIILKLLRAEFGLREEWTKEELGLLYSYRAENIISDLKE